MYVCIRLCVCIYTEGAKKCIHILHRYLLKCVYIFLAPSVYTHTHTHTHTEEVCSPLSFICCREAKWRLLHDLY